MTIFTLSSISTKLLSVIVLLNIRRVQASESSSQKPLRLSHESSNEPWAGLSDFIQTTQEEWHIPGVSVGIIEGDKSWTKGFGYSQLGTEKTDQEHDAVLASPKTLFYCGSTTKSFTAAAASLLVDDNQLYPHITWDTPISSIIRDDFVLSDPWATTHITFEDALSHRTGYPSHNMGINNSDPQECVRRLRHLPMSAEPRVTWQYSNYMFTTVGYVIEKVTGKWLGDFFREKIWSPLGMDHTYLTREEAEANADGLDLAAEYWWDHENGTYVEVPHLPSGRGREGAGMVISNVEDYLKYLRTMMDRSPPMSKEGHAALVAPHAVISPEPSWPYIGPLFYGFGWTGGFFAGEEFHSHNGRIREHVTELWFFPRLGFGVVVMINANEPPVAQAIAWRAIYDHLGIAEDKRRFPGKGSDEDTGTFMTSCRRHLHSSTSANPNISTNVDFKIYEGAFWNPGYESLQIKVSHGCDIMGKCEGSSSSSSLTTSSAMGFDGLTYHIVLEHVDGAFWIGWAYVEEHSQTRPELCMRVEIQVDIMGQAKRVGLDLRQDEDEALRDLVWFDRSL